VALHTINGCSTNHRRNSPRMQNDYSWHPKAARRNKGRGILQAGKGIEASLRGRANEKRREQPPMPGMAKRRENLKESSEVKVALAGGLERNMSEESHESTQRGGGNCVRGVPQVVQRGKTGEDGGGF